MDLGVDISELLQLEKQTSQQKVAESLSLVGCCATTAATAPCDKGSMLVSYL